jgi:hypothetical protein
MDVILHIQNIFEIVSSIYSIHHRKDLAELSKGRRRKQNNNVCDLAKNLDQCENVMSTEDSIGNLALKVANRAINNRNKRNDPFSRAARALLDTEERTARNVVARLHSETPESLKSLKLDEESFFEALHEIARRHVIMFLEDNPGAKVVDAPSYTLCGYTANALAERCRRNDIDSRVVYGHHIDDRGRIVYHYWTEATVLDNNIQKKYVIDATYHQLDESYKRGILIYPASDISLYGLKEFKKDALPVIGDSDIATLSTLEKNNGLLPMRDHIEDLELMQSYNKLAGMDAPYVNK